MTYENLKSAIKQAIKQNGNQEITGNLLQSTLLSIVNTLEAEYNSTPTVANSSTESDLDISDEYGNVLVRFASGHIKVKNFDSADINESISAILSNIGFDEVSEADLDISDEHGNVIMRLKDGHIQTQKFNSLTSAGGGKITYSIIKNL